MTTKSFLPIWGLVTISSLIIDILSVDWWIGGPEEKRILIAGTLFFSVFGLGLFFLARTQTSKERSGTFMGLFLVSILVKFSGAILLLFAFQSKVGTVPRPLLGVFISTYVVFLVFETWFMMVLGKQTQ